MSTIYIPPSENSDTVTIQSASPGSPITINCGGIYTQALVYQGMWDYMIIYSLLIAGNNNLAIKDVIVYGSCDFVTQDTVAYTIHYISFQNVKYFGTLGGRVAVGDYLDYFALSSMLVYKFSY